MAVKEAFAYLRARDAKAAVEFYRAAFGAKPGLRLDDPSGRIGHVELHFGATTVMLSDAFPEYGINAPAEGEEPRFAIHLHVDDADAVIAAALKAGAELIRPATDFFYGERSGTVRCPFGYDWMVGHEIEKVAPEEMQRRYDAMT